MRWIHFESKAISSKSIGVVQRAFYPVMIVSQCFAIFPASGNLGNDPNDLSFSLKSVSSIFSFIVIILATVFFGTSFPFSKLWSYAEGEFDFSVARHTVFCGISISYRMAFVVLASKWKHVMSRWLRLERRMAKFQSVHIEQKVALFTIVFLTLSLCEHLMSYPWEAPCLIVWRKYLKHPNGPIDYFELNWWKGIYEWTINFVITVSWNFTDLFLSAVSIALGSHFEQFNFELEKSTKSKGNSITYWKTMRETYNHLALFTKFMEKKLSVFVVLSFFNNICFVLFQLFDSFSFKNAKGRVGIYFVASFSHIVFRLCCVCLTAASIYERSKRPIRFLFSVPTENYNVEVHRLLLQVLFDRLTLSGYNFFYLTKALLLTLAGSILTYEIFLFQFKSLKSDVDEDDGDWGCDRFD